MKDLITEIISSAGGAAGGGDGTGTVVAAGSLFTAHMPSVLDVRHRLMK